tara:strand:- start:12951 stop:13904 length:954 start_codon:yes stop_codon:yes gene_type:complete
MSSFLDNSGDIILDAVLTDIGRARLARGDGSFKIVAYSFGDDEINYELYDDNLASGQKDLNILQTPVLEAFTDSRASMKYKLLTLSTNNILYLPVARINTTNQPVGFPYASVTENPGTQNQFVVIANEETADAYIGANAAAPKQIPTGFVDGSSPLTAANTPIIIDQGLDTLGKSFKSDLLAELQETVYMIKADMRLLGVVDRNGFQLAPSFVDQDNLATYIVKGEQMGFGQTPGGPGSNQGDSVIAGPRGPTYNLRLCAGRLVGTGTHIFTQLGTTNSSYGTKSISVQMIDTVVRVISKNLGFQVDVPVRVIRKNA